MGGFSTWHRYVEDGWRDVVESAAGAFDHDEQHFEPANFTVEKGDSLRTVCRYDTSEDAAPISFGPATSDEMCMQVFLYWPKQYTFLCGYYGSKVFWCGDAGGFVRKSGTDAEFHADRCVVKGSRKGGFLSKMKGLAGGLVAGGKKGGGGGGGGEMSCDEKNVQLGLQEGDGGGGDDDDGDVVVLPDDANDGIPPE